MPDRIMITGAAGFIGGYLARACLDAGWAVTAVDLKRPDSLAALGSEVVQADAAEPGVLSRVRSGEFAAVLHQAAITDTLEDDWDALAEANVRVPEKIARACADSGTLLVYASSSSVYGKIRGTHPVPESAAGNPLRCSGPLNAYGRSKLLLDERMREMAGALPWMGLRYTNVFGPGEEPKGRMASIISQLLRGAAESGRVTLFSDTLPAARDYIPVDTVAEVVLRLLQVPVPSGIYNLGSACPVSFATLARWCAEFRDDGTLDVRLVPNPIPDRYQYFTCADMTALRHAMPELHAVGPESIRRAAAVLYGCFSHRATPLSAGTLPDEGGYAHGR